MASIINDACHVFFYPPFLSLHAFYQKMVPIQRVLYYRPFVPLIRGTEYAEDSILLIFAERAKINKPKPFGQITLTLIN